MNKAFALVLRCGLCIFAVNMSLSKCNCVNCSGHIEFEATQAGSTVTCPHCNLETTLFIPAITTAAQAKAAHAIKAALESKATARVRSYLTFIRSNSAYRTLRSVINVFWAILTFLAVAFLISFIVVFLTRDLEVSGVLPLLGAAAYCVGSIVLLIALRQSAFLLIDIADTLIHEHSKGWTNSQEA
jgi:hypothetical protein